MIEGFARTIPGMVVEGNTPKIVNKIRPAHNYLGVQDIKFALKTAKKISKKFDPKSADNKKIFEGDVFNEHFKGIKGIVTGPTTLVLSCRIEGFYSRDNKDQIILDMAAALKKEATELQNAGAAMIQIDEPFLSTGVCDVELAKKALKIVTKDLVVPVSIHVCGDVGKIFSKLLKFPVQIIDCEFAGMSSNINTIEQLFDGSKKIGLGCIDTKNQKIEPIEQVTTIIKKGIDIVGEENIVLDPDCGMRMLSRDVALQKLRRMTEAVKWLQ